MTDKKQTKGYIWVFIIVGLVIAYFIFTGSSSDSNAKMFSQLLTEEQSCIDKAHLELKAIQTPYDTDSQMQNYIP
jgi:hypothetical protein